MGRRTLAPGDVSQLWGVRAAPLSPSQRGCHPGAPRGGGAGPWPGRWDGVGALPLWQLPRVGMNGAALPRALSVQAVPVPTSPAGTAHWAGGVTLAPVTRCSEATSPATAWVTLPGTETGTGAMGAAPSAVGTPGMAGHGDTVRGRPLQGGCPQPCPTPPSRHRCRARVAPSMEPPPRLPRGGVPEGGEGRGGTVGPSCLGGCGTPRAVRIGGGHALALRPHTLALVSRPQECGWQRSGHSCGAAAALAPSQPLGGSCPGS